LEADVLQSTIQKALSMQILLQDLRYALRTLRKNPGFTAVGVLTLALGIGANTAIFTVVNAVLLRPLPYPEPNGIVQLMHSSPEWNPGGTDNVANPQEFVVWREQTQAFRDIAAYDEGGSVNLTGGDHPEQLKSLNVSADYFRLFGAPVEIGRTFTAQEDIPGGPRLVVISYGFWRRRFGADRTLLGKAILLGDEPYVVIGVLGRRFVGDQPVEVWLPLQFDPNSTQGVHNLRVAARMKPGITLEMAKAQMKLAAEQFRRKFPAKQSPLALGRQESFTAEPLHDVVVGDTRPALLVLLGAVSLVLLIACTNVANLLLARATGRRCEMAIRAALGAGRRRIVSQFLTESVVLSFAGGTLGLGLGYAGVRALLAMNPGDIPRIAASGSAVALDWRVLGFTLLVSLSTGVLAGILPVLTASDADVSSTLNESGMRSGSGRRQNKARSILVVTEMALAFALLAGAALLIRTFRALRTVDPGFDAHNVLTMEMSLTGTRFQKTAAVTQLIREAQRRVESLPGVVALAATYWLPLDRGIGGGPFEIEGRPNDHYGAGANYVSPRYFKVFQIPLLRGRTFTDRDNAMAPGIVLINQTLAQGGSGGIRWSASLLWPHGNPVGERIYFGKSLGPPFADFPLQIIGIVGTVKDQALSENPQPTIYLPLPQLTDAATALASSSFPITWAIRTKADPYPLMADIQRELRIASGGLPVAHIRSMDEVVEQSTARNRFNMVLLSIFAGLAVLLAAIGIYGVMSYSVGQRVHEIGVRMALGAGARNVLSLVLRQGLSLVLVGIAVGVTGGVWLTEAMKSLLFGVSANDPLTFVTVGILLLAVAAAATYIPAHRATKVDPIVALKYE
jgi:predicted permease